MIPKEKDSFPSLNEAIEMYRKYGKAVGFGIRMGTSTYYGDYTLRKKTYKVQQVWSTKENKSIDTLTSRGLKKKERKSYHKVTGCMAMIGYHRDHKSDTFTVYKFQAVHNHPLNDFDQQSICSKIHKLTICDQELIVKASTLNIGATKAHKLQASLKGGCDNVTASKIDYKNFWRDYMNIVGPNDAQCVVDQLQIRRDNYPNFHFEYKLDDKVLNVMFWTDKTAKENYSKFSDVISMDATYRTNRYISI